MMRKVAAWLVLSFIPAFGAGEMTVYELQPPETHQFAIIYDVTAVREGATYFLNPIRAGSTATRERVIERSTGKELRFETVTGKESFIKVYLTQPVPKGGETRIRILKTYTHAPSYGLKDGLLVFDRPLGIKRNVVVLPSGWELIGSASPGIVSTGADGRVRISFLNDRDDQLPVKITARRLP